MIQRLRHIFLALTLLLAPIASLAIPGVAHAATGTFTWTGGDASSGDWSTGDNWQGGQPPLSSDTGDTIIIDNSATFTHGSTDNISGLNIANLEFENNGSSTNPIQIADPLTITGSIIQEPSDTTTTNSIENGGIAETITIGGNVTVTSNAGLILGGQSTPDTLSITGGDTLAFADSGAPNIDVLYDVITGSNVTVTYNGSATQYQLNDTNTYSGTTNVDQTFTGAPGLSVFNTEPFGTSTVNVADGANIEFAENISSLNNTVNIAGSSASSPPVTLNWGDLLSGTFTIPNIVLNGDTDFSNDAAGSLTVNLSGITVNGHCIFYSNTNDPESVGASANSFTGGPAECSSGTTPGTSTTASAPKTPDTGLAAIVASPWKALFLSAGAAFVLVAIARRLGPAKYSSLLKR